MSETLGLQQNTTKSTGQRPLNKYIQIEQLPRETQVEIASVLFEEVPELADHWSWEYTLQEITGLPDPLVLSLEESNLSTLPSTLNVSPIATEKYRRLFLRGQKPPPILLNQTKILDGCHRIAAARLAGQPTLNALQIHPLITMDWATWLAGQTPANAPVRSKYS
jgi:hypothetical protein